MGKGEKGDTFNYGNKLPGQTPDFDHQSSWSIRCEMLIVNKYFPFGRCFTLHPSLPSLPLQWPSHRPRLTMSQSQPSVPSRRTRSAKLTLDTRVGPTSLVVIAVSHHRDRCTDGHGASRPCPLLQVVAHT